MKTQTEILIMKVTKLELVIMLLLQTLRVIDPNNNILDKAEKILSQG